MARYGFSVWQPPGFTGKGPAGGKTAFIVTLKFLALLHLTDKRAAGVNLAPGGGSPLQIYVACAITCARSYYAQGYPLTLVTNHANLINQTIESFGLSDDPPLEVEQFEFSLDVPEGVRFRGAHFQIELFKAAGLGAYGDLVGIVDPDTVAIDRVEVPANLKDRVFALDQTRELVSDIGHARIRDDIQYLSGIRLKEPIWYGAEFKAGTPAAFARFYDEVMQIWPRYLSGPRDYGHHGAETPLTAALAREKTRPVDAGASGTIVRWWSARTTFEQMRLSEAARYSILHLPADKEFMAARANMPFERESFLKAYRSHVKRKLLTRWPLAVIDGLLGRPRKYAPRLG